MAGAPDGLRLLYRTRHIFILLAGLLNLGIGIYFSYGQQLWRKVLQWLGSGLIVTASLLFIAAFFYEPKLENLYTPLSHWGAYTIVAGTFCHLLSSARPRALP
jgi:FtsH-binding integral membrane protein